MEDEEIQMRTLDKQNEEQEQRSSHPLFQQPTKDMKTEQRADVGTDPDLDLTTD